MNDSANLNIDDDDDVAIQQNLQDLNNQVNFEMQGVD